MTVIGTAVTSALCSLFSSCMLYVGKTKNVKKVTTNSPAPLITKNTSSQMTSKAPTVSRQPTIKNTGDATIPSNTSKIPEVVASPVTDTSKTYTVRATYYGPDKIHGIHGGNDNIFEHIPASQYTASQLRTLGNHFCAMSEKFLRKGFMGSIIRVTGSKSTMDVVVVDMLPDRNDGKGVEIDIHDMADWEALGGNEDIGMQTVKFKVVGKASLPVPSNSPWDPKKFGY